MHTSWDRMWTCRELQAGSGHENATASVRPSPSGVERSDMRFAERLEKGCGHVPMSAKVRGLETGAVLMGRGRGTGRAGGRKVVGCREH